MLRTTAAAVAPDKAAAGQKGARVAQCSADVKCGWLKSTEGDRIRKYPMLLIRSHVKRGDARQAGARPAADDCRYRGVEAVRSFLGNFKSGGIGGSHLFIFFGG